MISTSKSSLISLILGFISFFFDFEGLKLDYFVRNRSFGNFALNNRHSNLKSMCFTVHFGEKSSEELKHKDQAFPLCFQRRYL